VHAHLVDHAEPERAILDYNVDSSAKQPPPTRGRSIAPHERGKGTQAGGTQTETSPEPGENPPAGKIFPSRSSARLRLRPLPLPSFADLIESLLGAGIPLHGGGLRAVGVGSALPRCGVRAGFRRQVREFSSLRFFFLDALLAGILRLASVSLSPDVLLPHCVWVSIHVNMYTVWCQFRSSGIYWCDFLCSL
jgi:hypothetical protein